MKKIILKVVQRKKNTIYQRVSKKYEEQNEKLQYKASKNFRGRK